jgi:hypothetical protein
LCVVLAFLRVRGLSHSPQHVRLIFLHPLHFVVAGGGGSWPPRTATARPASLIVWRYNVGIFTATHERQTKRAHENGARLGCGKGGESTEDTRDRMLNDAGGGGGPQGRGASSNQHKTHSFAASCSLVCATKKQPFSPVAEQGLFRPTKTPKLGDGKKEKKGPPHNPPPAAKNKKRLVVCPLSSQNLARTLSFSSTPHCGRTGYTILKSEGRTPFFLCARFLADHALWSACERDVPQQGGPPPPAHHVSLPMD